MSARHEFPHIGEIEILRYQKATLSLSCEPDDLVVSTCKPLGQHGVDIMRQACKNGDECVGNILVQLDSHRTCASETGRSSWAEAAAKAIAARTSVSVSVGKS